MTYGENLGTGTLSDELARIAERIRSRRDDGYPTDDEMVEDARRLMEGAMVMWMTVIEERMEDA